MCVYYDNSFIAVPLVLWTAFQTAGVPTVLRFLCERTRCSRTRNQNQQDKEKDKWLLTQESTVFRSSMQEASKDTKRITPVWELIATSPMESPVRCFGAFAVKLSFQGEVMIRRDPNLHLFLFVRTFKQQHTAGGHTQGFPGQLSEKFAVEKAQCQIRCPQPHPVKDCRGAFQHGHGR